jgi:hypothetical protein
MSYQGYPSSHDAVAEGSACSTASAQAARDGGAGWRESAGMPCDTARALRKDDVSAGDVWGLVAPVSRVRFDVPRMAHRGGASRFSLP